MEPIQSSYKLYLIESMGLTYVGKLVEHKDNTVELLDAVKFTVEPLTNQKGEIIQIFIGNQIGRLIEYPDDVYISELSDKSPYFAEYYKNTANLTLVQPGAVPRNLKSIA